MDKRIIAKVRDHNVEFKNSIRDKLVAEFGESVKLNDIIQWLYDYEGVILDKDDFSKRKRVKNVVHLSDRCIAKRASNEQCTRRRKDGCEYCGTHLKGTPHGTCDEIISNALPDMQKIQVWAQDIKGIMYYVDNMNNVYQAEDVISNKPDPKIIAKYVKNGEVYNIPEFGI